MQVSSGRNVGTALSKATVQARITFILLSMSEIPPNRMISFIKSAWSICLVYLLIKGFCTTSPDLKHGQAVSMSMHNLEGLATP